MKKKLLEISASTIGRMLAKEKAKFSLKGRSRTKPGTLMRNQVPIRTFCDFDEKKEGFVEIDLVSHHGGNGKGEFIQTLDVTDVLTGWTETEAVKNKAQKWVFEALKNIQARLPFPLLGIDSDNGSEFINVYLLKFCEENEVTFTRTRPYRKNDPALAGLCRAEELFGGKKTNCPDKKGWGSNLYLLLLILDKAFSSS